MRARTQPRFRLVQTTCSRCGTPIMTSNRPLIGTADTKALYGTICGACITPAEHEAMDQAFRSGGAPQQPELSLAEWAAMEEDDTAPEVEAERRAERRLTSHYDDRPLRYDDTYIGPRYTYGLTYRPLSSSNVPRDWILFSDRPHPDFRHGTVQYPRQLTSGEVAAFQLVPLPRRFAHCHSNSCVWHDERAADDPVPFPDYCPDCWSSVDVSAEGDSPIDEG